MRYQTSFRLRRRERTATAMVEFVFCLPLIVLVFGCVFFFGTAMTQKMRVQMANYHSVWRAVQEEQSAPSEGTLNADFFNRHGRNIHRDAEGSILETFEDYRTKADSHHALAGEMLDEIYDNSPRRGKTERLSMDFDTQVGLYRRFVTDPFTARFTRDARPWRRSQWRPLQYAVPEKYLDEFDRTLGTMGDPAVADTLRRLYHNGW